jgi:hypothetical protein
MANRYSYAQGFTVAAAEVGAGPHTNFVVCIQLTATQYKTVANGGKVQNASGFDIVFSFTRSAKPAPASLLNWEIEKWDGTTGQLVAWVQIPSLSSAVDTVVYAMFGNAAITVAQNTPANTWDATFQAVFHLAQAMPVSTPNSATGNGVGALVGIAGTPPTFTAAGVFDGAVTYTAGASYETVPIAAWPSLPCTLICFTNSAGGFAGGFADLCTLLSSLRIGIEEIGATFRLYYVRDAIVGIAFPTIIRNKSVLTMWAVTVDAAGTGINGYSFISPGSSSQLGPDAPGGGGAVNANGGNVTIAAKNSADFRYLGFMEEPRFERVVRSAAWLQTIANNAFSATFITAGPVFRFPTGGGLGFRWFFDEDGRDEGDAHEWE